METVAEIIADPESDAEEDEETVTVRGDNYEVQWENKFVDGISICGRGQRTKDKARMNNYRECNYLTKLAVFKIFSPIEYYRKHLLPATNEELKNNK